MEKTKAAENLSHWFNLAEQKPWEPGVYEVEFKSFDENIRLAKSFFDGQKFNFLSHEMYGFSVEKAFEERKKRGGGKRVVRWRGLASDPSAKPKPKPKGNRKVTRYVVMDDIERKPVASFATKKAAENYEESMMVFSSIEKIRFRTPESD